MYTKTYVHFDQGGTITIYIVNEIYLFFYRGSLIIHQSIKAVSQRFVYDLAKSDLAFYYKQCLVGIEEVKRRDRYNKLKNYQHG